MPDSRTVPINPSTSRLHSLTGLRFVAAFAVLVCHAGISLAPRISGAPPWVHTYFTEAGARGVSFFFVLSGFVLAWVAKPSEGARPFWRRRAVKVYPNHLVTLVMAAALALTAGNVLTAANTLPTLFLVQTWIPDQSVVQNFPINGASWSLTCEAFFYLCFPVVLPLLRRIRSERIWHWIVGVGLLPWLFPVIAQLLPEQPQMLLSPQPWWQYWFVYYLPLTRMAEFVVGILVALAVMNGRWIRIGVGPPAALVVVVYVLGGLLPELVGVVAPGVLPAALLIGAVAVRDCHEQPSWLRSKPMVWLGDISYAFFVVHFVVVCYGPIRAADLDSWTSPVTVPHALLLAVETLVISVVAAWVLYLVVERPVMRRFSRPRTKPAAAATVPEEPVGERAAP